MPDNKLPYEKVVITEGFGCNQESLRPFLQQNGIHNVEFCRAPEKLMEIISNTNQSILTIIDYISLSQLSTEKLQSIKNDNLTLILSETYDKLYKNIFDGYLKTLTNQKLLLYLIKNRLVKPEKSPYDRVIITEDNEAQRALMGMCLETDAEFCANDNEVLKYFKDISTKTGQSILLLMDYNLGKGLNGAQITEEIRRVYGEKINLTITLYSTGESLQKGEEQLFDGFIKKPSDIEDIIEVIQNGLERFLIKSFDGQLASS